MARVTVEDCVQRIPNRFELVLLAAQRARNLSRGEELTVERDDDKNPVVALREIAEETISIAKLEQDLVKSLSRSPEPEPADEEVLDLIPTDQNIFGLQDVSAEEEAATLPGGGDVARGHGGRHRGRAGRPPPLAPRMAGGWQRDERARLRPLRAPDGTAQGPAGVLVRRGARGRARTQGPRL